MVVANIIILLLNLIILAFGYYLIKNKIERSLVNKELIKKVKEEVNSIIIQLNEATLNNINLIEEKKRNLDKLVILADKKKNGLNSKITKEQQLDFDAMLRNDDKPVYTPEKIAKQKKIVQEVKKENIVKVKTIEDEIKGMPIIDKINYLSDKGYKEKDIIKITGISSGELELILNIENNI